MRVVARRVQDGDAHLAVFVDLEGGRGAREGSGEGGMSVDRNRRREASAERWVASLPFGCHIDVLKRISGGLLGKSSGKVSLAEKKPPS